MAASVVPRESEGSGDFPEAELRTRMVVGDTVHPESGSDEPEE